MQWALRQTFHEERLSRSASRTPTDNGFHSIKSCFCFGDVVFASNSSLETCFALAHTCWRKQGNVLKQSSCLPPSIGFVLFPVGVFTRNVSTESIVLHEIGHTIGFGHSRDYNSIMHTYYKRSFTFPSLHFRDVLAVQALYGEFL